MIIIMILKQLEKLIKQPTTDLLKILIKTSKKQTKRTNKTE